MNESAQNVAVIGGGAAGMCAALELASAGKKVTLLEREPSLGGILHQCIHNGFGLSYFKEELTGPEFAFRLEDKVKNHPGIALRLSTTVVSIEGVEGGKKVTAYGKASGVISLECGAVVLAMGSRERNRGNIPIPGTRPSGIYTAGSAQRMVNIEGIMPGKRAVIVGSGDIGLIMARRLTWSGIEVLGVVEIQPYPAGLTRNIVQCLNDFSIPLYLSHAVSRVYGRDRVTGVEVTSLDNHNDSFFLSSDTLLLSVGLIPENELSKNAGVGLDAVTRGAVVNAGFMTDTDGIFSCGNVLHIHDLVDYCAMEAEECARGVVRYLDGNVPVQSVKVFPGANVRYTVPQSLFSGEAATISLRSLVAGNGCTLSLMKNGEVLKKKKLAHVQPSEMIRLGLSAEETAGLTNGDRLEAVLSC